MDMAKIQALRAKKNEAYGALLAVKQKDRAAWEAELRSGGRKTVDVDPDVDDYERIPLKAILDHVAAHGLDPDQITVTSNSYISLELSRPYTEAEVQAELRGRYPGASREFHREVCDLEEVVRALDREILDEVMS
jgi:hypothetical protein